MNIKDINISDMIIERQYINNGVYNRTVYFNEKNNTYIKLWDYDFFYRQYFENAYYKGFFTKIAEIEDIIADDKNNILGYIIKKAQPITIPDKSKLNDLITRIAYNCYFHNMVYLDFTIQNIVENNDKYFLIDLCSSIPVAHLNKISKIADIISYNNYFYRKEIDHLLGNFNTYTLKQCTHPDKEIKYGTANGRIFLEKEYLPSLDGKIFFVGVNYYTEFYHKLVKTPDLFETLDVAESVIDYVSPYTHYICDIRNFQQQGYLYDHVCFFGIIGHSDSDWEIIKEKEDIIKTIKILDSLVKPGGTLLFAPALQTLTMEFWDEMFALPEFQNYELLMLKRIDINYIWYGRKR